MLASAGRRGGEAWIMGESRRSIPGGRIRRAPGLVLGIRDFSAPPRRVRAGRIVQSPAPCRSGPSRSHRGWASAAAARPAKSKAKSSRHSRPAMPIPVNMAPDEPSETLWGTLAASSRPGREACDVEVLDEHGTAAVELRQPRREGGGRFGGRRRVVGKAFAALMRTPASSMESRNGSLDSPPVTNSTNPRTVS